MYIKCIDLGRPGDSKYWRIKRQMGIIEHSIIFQLFVYKFQMTFSFVILYV